MTPMKANELRIGNFLNHSYLNIAKDLDAWWIYGIELGGKDAEWWSPIKLTEEWLIKFGFEPNGVYKSMRKLINNDKTQKKLTYIVSTFDGYAWIEIIESSNNRYISLQTSLMPMKYVHQLQNLYFALTGEELELAIK